MTKFVKLVNLFVPDLRVFRVHCGLFSPAVSSFIPELCRLLLLRSSSLSLEELRTVARASQLLSVRLHPLSLDTQAEGTMLMSIEFLTVKLMLICTYRTLLEAFTTGNSRRRASSEAEYFFRSQTSRSSSEDSNMKTRADH